MPCKRCLAKPVPPPLPQPPVVVSIERSKADCLCSTFFCYMLVIVSVLSVFSLFIHSSDKMLFSVNSKILIFFLLNVCCGYSLEAPRQGASNEHHQHMFLWRNTKNVRLIPTHIYCASDIFQKVFCLALYAEEIILQIFVMI